MLRHLSLFSGIGAFELGIKLLEDTTIETKMFVEMDPIAKAVLNKHYPNIPNHSDIRDFTAQPNSYDVITCSFPCTNTSSAGKRNGLSGEESSLWWEGYRVIKECCPKYTIIENPEGLRHRGLNEVLYALAEIGYCSEWASIRASHFGAPHHRERIFIVSYPNKWLSETQQPSPWSSQIGEMVQRLKAFIYFPKFVTTNDGVSVRFPQGLDAVPLGVEKGSCGRIQSRYLFGRTILPQQCAIALARVLYLEQVFNSA